MKTPSQTLLPDALHPWLNREWSWSLLQLNYLCCSTNSNLDFLTGDINPISQGCVHDVCLISFSIRPIPKPEIVAGWSVGGISVFYEANALMQRMRWKFSPHVSRSRLQLRHEWKLNLTLKIDVIHWYIDNLMMRKLREKKRSFLKSLAAVGFEVLTEVAIKSTMFWVTPCSSAEVHRRLVGTYCLYLQRLRVRKAWS
jgi:hypothetical protein